MTALIELASYQSKTDGMNAMTARVRADIPRLNAPIDGRPVTYLDSAATSLKPQCVIDAIVRYYTEVSANIHRGKHILSDIASTEYEHARYAVAQFLGVPSREIVFTRNATHALNTVAGGLGLTSHDRVVVCGDAHHSNLLPWRAKGAECLTVRVGRDGTLDLDHFHSLLAKRPKVVALNHCSNVTGLYVPVHEMAVAANKAGAVVVVDGAQSVPHARLTDLGQTAIDFVAVAGHKMLGPTGVGILWGRGEQLEQLRITELGGGAVDWVDPTAHRLRDIPHRFEAGTPDIASVLGMEAAVSYLEEVGGGYLREHDARLAQALTTEAASRDYIELVGPTDADRSALISFSIRGVPQLDDIARCLSDSYGIMARTGHLCAQPLVSAVTDAQLMRFSGYAYTTTDEIELAFDALDTLVATSTHPWRLR